MNAATAAFAYVVIHHLHKRKKRRQILNDEVSTISPSEDLPQPSSPKIPRVVFSFHDDLQKIFPQMAVPDFEHLLSLVEPMIQDPKSNVQNDISPREKLTAILKYLVTGQALTEISQSFNIPLQSVYVVTTEICNAIIESLKCYMKVNFITIFLIFISKNL